MKIGRNEPCHCGSGKKYKACCMRKPNDDYDEKKRKSEARMAATPEASPDATSDQSDADVQIDQCLDHFHDELQTETVESIFKLTDKAVEELKLSPAFTYGDIAQAVADDDRFELAKGQLCCLAGGDPVKLYVKRLGF
jgi:hypothetical protein